MNEVQRFVIILICEMNTTLLIASDCNYIKKPAPTK